MLNPAAAAAAAAAARHPVSNPIILFTVYQTPKNFLIFLYDC